MEKQVIEGMREKLNKMIERYDYSMTHPKVIEYSKKLDKLILEEMRALGYE